MHAKFSKLDLLRVMKSHFFYFYLENHLRYSKKVMHKSSPRSSHKIIMQTEPCFVIYSRLAVRDSLIHGQL